MTTCNTDNLLLLACGELDAERAASVRDHVAACPACAAELSALERDMAALDALPELEPPAEVTERIRAAGREATERRRLIRPWFRHRAAATALAAAAVVALVIGASIFVGGPEDAAPADAAQLAALWSDPAAEILDSGMMVEELADANQADPWAEAVELALAARAEPARMESDLLELQDGLDLLEQMDWGS